MTKTLVEGLGHQKSLKQQFRGIIVTVECPPKMKLKVVAANRDVNGIVHALVAEARTGEIGDDKIFILPIEGAIRAGIGDEGENTI